MEMIQPATLDHVSTLVDLGRTTFVQSHGHSASKADIDDYLHSNYTNSVIANEIAHKENIYRLFYHDEKAVGFSKTRLNQPIVAERWVDGVDSSLIDQEQVAKLDRIYLLADYHGRGFAQSLLLDQVALAKANKQLGMWLYTWVENERAIRFYHKMGFQKVGQFDFKISAHHTNPNWIFYLPF